MSLVRRLDMVRTGNHADNMEKMIQVRNVPDVLHRALKARAATAGMSLSGYLLGELREIAERPNLTEFRERLHTRRPVSASFDTAALLRESTI
jgi:antitoxin FitA